MASLVHDTHHDSALHHQFENIEQQNESYLVGMWAFLVTEIMFFGALFATYALYRWKYQDTWYAASQQLDWKLGALNTCVLLFSSFTMVMGVRSAQLKDKKKILMYLGLTIACACVFLVVKYFEYSAKFEHHLVPGAFFHWTNPASISGMHLDVNPNAAQLFFSLYFVMTGLHGVHILIGIIMLAVLAAMHFKENPLVKNDYVPTEMIGLYWHFVDLVWIFLFPLYYLIPGAH